MDIIRKTHFVARDSNGIEYEIKGWKSGLKYFDIEHEDVPGELEQQENGDFIFKIQIGGE